VTIGADKGLL